MAPELRAQKTQLTLSACKRDNGRKKKKKIRGNIRGLVFGGDGAVSFYTFGPKRSV